MSLVILLTLAILTINIWYYISLQTAMDTISQRNRSMSGGLVWLNIIPIFGYVWAFVFNSAVKNSFKKEFKELGIKQHASLISGMIYPGFTILFTIFIYAVPYVLYGTFDINYVYYSSDGVLVILICIISLIANIVFWINFWINVVSLKNQLQSSSLTNHTNIVDNSRSHSEINIERINTSSNYSTKTPESQVPISKPIVNPSSMHREESAIDKIKKYHDLLKDGLISQDEFERIKKEIIDNDK